MVVVADDDSHKMPMCVATREKDWSVLVCPDIDGFWNNVAHNDTTQVSLSDIELLVIVGGQTIYDAVLNYKNVDLNIYLRFGPNSTVREIKYAIASRLYDTPALDSFRIYISDHSSTDLLELTGDNKTISEFPYELNALEKYKISFVRIGIEERTEHRRVCINDVYLQMTIMNLTGPLPGKDFEKMLFVSESTTVSQLIKNMLEEMSVYGFVIDDVRLRFENIVTNIADGEKTLKELGLDFTECRVIDISLSDSHSGKLSGRNQAVFIADDDDVDLKPWDSCARKINRDLESDDNTSLGGMLFTPREEYGPRESPETETKSEILYVGLINQAMTCYLNSLLQALYMTPEFRNALYNWEYIDDSEKDEAKSIPYQLQKLFLNLQTSKKNAVETTSLTKSFGWDSTEAWQQHDIQELCRVMFDALEQKFKNTQQADLINRLYEGKMIDYVKCLECGTEKSREDTFLDIPLPLKPFGSTTAYNSVEEALRAFVQPETLDGVNQYFCETCNKKCDAHKGLKFTKFPYILTLHLKRFDFDYNSFHRIKLNDKVTFPDILNVNSLIPSSSSTDNQDSPSTEDEIGTGIKCDDSSTTDSGHLDECLPCDNGIGIIENTISNNEQDDDEGIYISNCPSTSSIHSQENERNRSKRDDCSFYKYDLFSIMIHSGSASGGHYYAYIKDFKTQEWLCFNDQNVSSITYDDIQKTYGGGPSRAFYSGAYSTSTNAYMLMYRQIDYERNCLPIKVEDFPKHIQALLKQMKDHEEKKNHDRSQHVYKIRIYCHHPYEKMLHTTRIFSEHEELLSETVDKARLAFFLNNISLDQCRLVAYDANYDVIEHSFVGQENEKIGTIVQANNTYQAKRLKAPDMLLDIRKKDEKFVVYHPGEISTTVFVSDVSAKKIIDGPFTVRVHRTTSITDYKNILSKITHIYPKNLRLHELLVRNERRYDAHECQLHHEDFYNGCKVFIETGLDDGDDDVDGRKSLRNRTKSMLNAKVMADLYEHMVMLHVQLPEINDEIMKKFDIPIWENRQIEKEIDKSVGNTKLLNSDSKIDKNDVETIIQKTEDETIGENEEWQEQSNSEDSSLSDSDRTLIGDASEEDFVALTNIDSELLSNSSDDSEDECLAEHFLRIGEKYGDPVERLKIYVHKEIMRNTLKKLLEPILKIPVKYFKIVRQCPESVDKKIPIGSFSDGETLNIKLCRAIRDGDFFMRLYLLRLKRSSIMNHEYICEFIVFKNTSVAQIKREIIVELKKNHNIDIPYERFRLRKKNSELPSTILLDDMTIDSFMKIDKDSDDICHGEFFIQELSGKEIVTNPNQNVLLAWRYNRATYVWDEDIHEIVLDTKSVTEVKTKLSELSGIPVDNVTFIKGQWPGDWAFKLVRTTKCLQQWIQLPDDEWASIIDVIKIIFYRDISEDDSTNTVEEGHQTVMSRLDRRNSRGRFQDPSWSPRREKALKIIVDDK